MPDQPQRAVEAPLDASASSGTTSIRKTREFDLHAVNAFKIDYYKG